MSTRISPEPCTVAARRPGSVSRTAETRGGRPMRSHPLQECERQRNGPDHGPPLIQLVPAGVRADEERREREEAPGSGEQQRREVSQDRLRGHVALVRGFETRRSNLTGNRSGAKRALGRVVNLQKCVDNPSG